MFNLKFRFWDKHFKVMRNVDAIYISRDMAICITGTAVGDRSCKLDELMQSTGHFDESALEIFEGDILRITTDDFETYTKVYREGSGLCIDYSYDDYSCGLFDWVIHWIEAENGIVEIIGNSYATPNLWSQLKKAIQ